MNQLRHMDPEEFRRHGYAMVDWVADYMTKVATLPIVPSVAPGDIRAMLPDSAPEEPEEFDAIAADLDRVILPGVTGWTAPGWFAFFPANVSGPGTLGELATAGLGQQGMLWATSPVCTELENVVADWMVDLLGLPVSWKTTGPGGGVIQQTASDGTHTAVVVARDRAQRAGAAIGDCVAYTSEQAHSSVEKGARVAGYQHIRLVATDRQYAMKTDDLAAAVSEDRRKGLWPAFVSSSVGTTATTAVDPVRQVGEIARREKMWHHVDAAFAGSAMICEEFRHYQDGLELVDSYTVNPYKWLQTNFDGSFFYVADREPLIQALSILPPYLRNQASESTQVIDYRDWHVPLGRRFRSLKIWFALRYYGAAALRQKIRHDVHLAGWIMERIAQDHRFELVAPAPFSLVCFRHVAGDQATDALAEAVNQSGHSYWTSSQLDGQSFLRISIGQTTTRAEHVERLWNLIDQAAFPQGGPPG